RLDFPNRDTLESTHCFLPNEKELSHYLFTSLRFARIPPFAAACGKPATLYFEMAPDRGENANLCIGPRCLVPRPAFHRRQRFRQPGSVINMHFAGIEPVSLGNPSLGVGTSK